MSDKCGACEAEKKYRGINKLHTCGKETQRAEHMAEGNKNEQVLRNFVDHCERHPEQRFWQCVQSWSKYSYIYGSMKKINIGDKDWLEDASLLGIVKSKI